VDAAAEVVVLHGRSRSCGTADHSLELPTTSSSRYSLLRYVLVASGYSPSFFQVC
jgi:hypothetical protein